jgi:hypothetical protein
MKSHSKNMYGLTIRSGFTESNLRRGFRSTGDPVLPKEAEPAEFSPAGLSPGGLLRDPTPLALRSALETVASSVNERARVRKVDPLPFKPVMREPFGLMEDNGNREANGHTFAPRTSWVGVAWCTFGGVKYVRVWGLRGYVHSQAHSFSFIPEATDRDGRRCCWAKVFPARFLRYRERRRDWVQRVIERIGPPGEDDRVNLNLRWALLSAHVPGLGVILSDLSSRTQLIQVVVRDPSTGFRHHISVPPRFGNPRTKTFRELRTPEARIHAAVAWTFGMKPDEYEPALEA